jgi:hypothetical protein
MNSACSSTEAMAPTPRPPRRGRRGAIGPQDWGAEAAAGACGGWRSRGERRIDGSGGPREMGAAGPNRSRDRLPRKVALLHQRTAPG